MLPTLAKAALVAFLVSTYKSLPLAYFFRFYSLVFKHIVLQRSKHLALGKNTYGIGNHRLDIFRAVSYDTYASPLEIDMYLHKSNLTYLVDLDLARTQFICLVFQSLFIKYWNNDSGDFKRRSLLNCPYLPVGSIQCVFKREITVFQKYSIKSSVLAWDHKWLYVLLKFELPGGKLCALAVTKYVFKKKGRITIKPAEFIADCGLYNDDVEAINKRNYKLVSHLETSEGLEELAAQMKV